MDIEGRTVLLEDLTAAGAISGADERKIRGILYNIDLLKRILEQEDKK